MNPTFFSCPSNSNSIFTKRRCLGLEIFTWLVSHQKQTNNKPKTPHFFLVTLCIQIEKILKHDSNMKTTVDMVYSQPLGTGMGITHASFKLLCSIRITCGPVILQQTWAPLKGWLGYISITFAKASVAFHQHKQHKEEHAVSS